MKILFYDDECAFCIHSMRRMLQINNSIKAIGYNHKDAQQYPEIVNNRYKESGIQVLDIDNNLIYKGHRAIAKIFCGSDSIGYKLLGYLLDTVLCPLAWVAYYCISKNRKYLSKILYGSCSI